MAHGEKRIKVVIAHSLDEQRLSVLCVHDLLVSAADIADEVAASAKLLAAASATNFSRFSEYE